MSKVHSIKAGEGLEFAFVHQLFLKIEAFYPLKKKCRKATKNVHKFWLKNGAEAAFSG